MRYLTVIALCATPLFGQFGSLATNDDGSVALFTTTLRMRGSTQNEYFKVFAADSSGVRLAAERERQVLPTATWPVTTFYSLQAADLSGDGSVQAIQGQRECHGGSGCIPISRWATDIVSRGAVLQSVRGRAALSRNGRYAAACCDGTLMLDTTLYDLQTGESWRTMGTSFPPGRNGVSSTGVVAVQAASALKLLSREGTQTIPLPATASGCVMDDRATAVFCTLANKAALVRVMPAIGAVTTVLAPFAGHELSISADGGTLAYVLDGRAVIHEVTSNTARPLTRTSDSVKQAVISGDGRIVYAGTTDGALLRIRTDTGAVETVIPSTTTIDSPRTSAAAGSFFRITGAGFSRDVTVRIDGVTAPVLQSSPTQLGVQIPWALATGSHTVEVVPAEPSPFETSGAKLEVATYVPRFEPVAVHAAWDRLVSAEYPIRPGAIIHLYMTGLGAVEGPMVDGEPAPLDRALRTVLPLFCTAGEEAVDVLFAGLAPGLTGFYQVSVRLPDTLPAQAGFATLTCGDAASLIDTLRLPAQI